MFELLLYVCAAFLAGILTFLAPCTLPILPAYLAHSASTQYKQVASQTFLFGLGLATVFTLMGIAAGTLGSFLINYKKEVSYVFGIVLILFGFMSLFGKNFSFFKLKPRSKKIGSFAFGSVFALTWSGCIGPVLGFMLILAANTQTMIGGGILLFVFSLGLMSPLFLVSIWLDRLPKTHRIWKILEGKLFTFQFLGTKRHLHTTNLLSGSLFMLLGIYLILESTFYLTGFFPNFLTEWTFTAQNVLMEKLGVGG